jgi:DNA-binding NarL/FixJ family response regulator
MVDRDDAGCPLQLSVTEWVSNGMTAACVLVVDDFEPWRSFVTSALKQQLHLASVHEVSDGLDAVQKSQALQPDLILLDVGLPTLNGLEAARQIRVLSPDSKIIFLTENDDCDVAAEAFRSGARGFVVKFDAEEELIAAVDAVLAGEQFLSRRLRGTFDFDHRQAAD